MKARTYKILKIILLNQGYYTIKSLANKFDVSTRTIRYDISKINEYLEDYNAKTFFDDQKKLNISKEKIEIIKKDIFRSNGSKVYYNSDKRVKEIIFYLFLSNEPVIIQQLIKKLNVSRSTIINDLKEVDILLKNYNLKIFKKRNYGIKISGKERDIRKAIIRMMNQEFKFVEFTEFLLISNSDPTLFNEYINLYKKLFNSIDLSKVKELVEYIEQELGYKLSEKSFYNLYFYLSLTIVRLKSRNYIKIPNELFNRTKKTSEFTIASKTFKIIDELFEVKSNNSEITNLTLRILASGISKNIKKNINGKLTNDLKIIANQMIKVVEKMIGIKLKDEELENGLLLHLKPLINRLNYDYENEVKNPLLEEIKNKYFELYEATKYSITILEATYNRKISEDEIGYIVMHFGAAYERRKRLFKNNKLATIIVCPSGLGTSNLLISKLEKKFNKLRIIKSISIKELRENFNKYLKYDLIISTVNLPYKDKKIIKISPKLTEFESIKLIKMINALKDFKNQKMIERYVFDIDTFYKEIKDHIIIKTSEKSFKENIYKFFESKNIPVNYNKRSTNLNKKGLIGLIKNKVRIIDEKVNWKNAINLIGKVLIENGDIEYSYIEEIFKLIEQKGPYFIISPGVALVHSKLSPSVKNTSIGFLVSKKDIIFDNSKSVNIIILLALKDKKSHLKALADILTIFENQNSLNSIINKNTEDEIIKYISSQLKRRN